MVGLKTFWILLCSLILFAACVPQTKQTECGSNEAFNASLRTCVPIVGGPSSFINISSYSPSFTQTRYKDDNTILSFSITVSNPYAQAYTIAWERVFNAGPVSMCTNSPTCSFPASLLGTTLGEIGSHILTAKILDTNGTVVTTHSFELKINDFPKPIINTTTYQPAFYSIDKIPTDPRVEFSFTIKNNNATIAASDNYRTTWTIVKNGTILMTEVDAFTNFSTTGTNLAYFGTYNPPSSVPAFNPASLGVGSYIVRAVVQNDSPGEVVDEHQWNVIIKQPDLAKVTTISLPSPGVTTTAHNGVDYNDYPTISWIYGSSATQPNFCVDVDDRDGTYSGDGKSIQVRFYLDSLGGDICTKTTLDTPGTQTICLIDGNNCSGSGLPFDTSLLKFTNSSSSIAQGHKVTARLFDEATSQEFQRSNVVPSNGSYPIEWNVMVNPINQAPMMAFGPAASNPTGCLSSGAFSKSGCQVSQGTPFTVSFTVTDDFYSPSLNPGQFLWDVKLKNNSADIATPPFVTSCSKALGATTPAYTTAWTCTLVVPHYIASGALNPNGPFQVVATMQDSGSPIGGFPLPAQSLTWDLVVTETNAINPNIQISAQGISPTSSHISRDTPLPITYLDPAGSNYATEMETVTFRLGVRDPELDDFTYAVYKCGVGSTAASCVSPVMITSSALNYLRGAQPPVVLPFIDTTNTDPVLVNAVSYTLTETLLLDAGYDVDKTTPKPFYFKVDVADKPSTLPSASVKKDSKIFTLYVRNYNPAPVIDSSSANPATNIAASAYNVLAGVPFSINPGTITDASVATSESTISYQWYASPDSGTTWALIPGATNKNLTWTPNRGAPTPVLLKLCVGDRPAANPINDPASGGNCTTNGWYVNPKTYFAKPTSPVAMNVSSDVAVWHDTFQPDATVDVIYTAYIGNDQIIYVNKTVRDATLNFNVTSFNTVSFPAITGSTTASAVKGISITGTKDSLYIAYSASNPSSNMIPRLRRIDKSFDATTVGVKTALAHQGKFGFQYTDISMTDTCTSASNCAFTAGSSTVSPKVTFDNGMATNDTITINGVTFTAKASPVSATDLCDSSICSAPTDIAANFGAKINASTDPKLQGITAFVSGAVVTLNGVNSYDALEWDGSSAIATSLVAKDIGKIFVVGNFWFLPIINSSLLPPDTNNISLISGRVDVRLQNGATPIDSSDTLTNIGEVKAFDNELNQADELVIASISADSATLGNIKVSRFTLSTPRNYDPFSAPAISQVQAFGTHRFQSVELGANTTGNNSVYVIGKEIPSDGGRYFMGRYAADFTGVGSENQVTAMVPAKIVNSEMTQDFVTDSALQSPSLVALPNTSDARLFFQSGGNVRVARWKADNTITCGFCEQIGDGGTTSKIAVSKVANKTIGNSGYIATENQKDFAFIFMNNAMYDSELGMINLRSEAIHSTTTDAAAFLWRTPFAK